MVEIKSADQTELKKLYDAATELNSYGFWTMLEELEPTDVRPREKAHVWHFDDFRPHLDKAAELVPIEEADRRAFIMHNPAYDMSKPFTTNSLFAAFQIINPGEVAAVHRHSPSASRMVLTGKGGYTTVDGEKCVLERGDLVITPNYSWHDHGNEGTESLIWCDILDIPIPYYMNAYFFDFNYEEGGKRINSAMQPVTRSKDYSQRIYGTGGVVPRFADHDRAKGYGSPQVHFKYSDVRAALEAMKTEKGSPFDDLIIDFRDPRNGGPLAKTQDFHMQLLRPGVETQSHRHTYCQVFVVLEGEGYTEIDGEKYPWKPNDVFCLPTFRWHHHVNTGDKDAVLYSVSDRAAVNNLGLLWEDYKNADGEIVRTDGLSS